MTPQTRLAVPPSRRDHRQGPETTAVTLVQYGDEEDREQDTLLAALQAASKVS